MRPIPIPLSRVWREIRIRVLPGLVFAAAAMATVLLWRQDFGSTSLMGEVEVVRSNVTSPKPGRLGHLNVTHLQPVSKGDVIGHVITADPEVLQSSLQVIQAEIQLLRLSLEAGAGQNSSTGNYDKLRLDWMEERLQLFSARVRLELAQAELHHAEELFSENSTSQQLLDNARSAQKNLAAEVEERSRLLAEHEEKLEGFRAARKDCENIGIAPNRVLHASLRIQEEKLRMLEAELKPVNLAVRMDGVVSAIHHRSGEPIAAGEPIVTLTATASDRIKALVPQSVPLEPKIGMKVQVRPRLKEPCATLGEIVEISPQMEPIPGTSGMRDGGLPEVGLPILVSVPDSAKLLPGEFVELQFLPGTEPAPSFGSNELQRP